MTGQMREKRAVISLQHYFHHAHDHESQDFGFPFHLQRVGTYMIIRRKNFI